MEKKVEESYEYLDTYEIKETIDVVNESRFDTQYDKLETNINKNKLLIDVLNYVKSGNLKEIDDLLEVIADAMYDNIKDRKSLMLTDLDIKVIEESTKVGDFSVFNRCRGLDVGFKNLSYLVKVSTLIINNILKKTNREEFDINEFVKPRDKE